MAYLNIFATTGYNFSAGALSLLILQKERKVRSKFEIVDDFVDSLPSGKLFLGVKSSS